MSTKLDLLYLVLEKMLIVHPARWFLFQLHGATVGRRNVLIVEHVNKLSGVQPLYPDELTNLQSYEDE
jgi:hypothetical protein